MKYSPTIILVVIAACLSLTSCTPTDSVAEFKSALELFDQQDYEAALQKANVCLRIDREDLEVIKLHALCVFNLETSKKYDADRALAIRNLKRAATNAPKDFNIRFFLGWAYFQSYNWDDAQQVLTEAYHMIPQELIPNSPIYANLLYMLGLCYAQHNLPDGLQVLKLLEHTKPFNEWADYYNSYAMLAYRLKKYNDAILWFKKAQAVAPQQPQPMQNIAVIYDTIYHKPDQARLFYVNALAKYQQQGLSFYVQKISARLGAL